MTSTDVYRKARIPKGSLGYWSKKAKVRPNGKVHTRGSNLAMHLWPDDTAEKIRAARKAAGLAA